MACPSCTYHHLATEVCGRDTSGGLAYRDRLAKARAAYRATGVAAVAVGEPLQGVGRSAIVRPEASGALDWLGPAELRKVEAKGALVKKGKGGRPPGPRPWKDRKEEHLRAYKREYMRGWRARKRGG